MFTGIIETSGEIVGIEKEQSNVHFDVRSNLSDELKVDQSVAHDGVCLTVINTASGIHRVTAIDETLLKSNLSDWRVGSYVNIERCMIANGRFDGHVVQGHVDQVGKVVGVNEKDGSWQFDLEYDPLLGNVTVEKGSICINGTSLTCFNSEEGKFSVAIIPYTYENTSFKSLQVGSSVNLEFDIIGKYVKRLLGQ
jgi:riboflavin synthase